MMTLEDAWAWYRDTRSHQELFRRLARKHWGSLSCEGSLSKDERFKTLDSGEIIGKTESCLEHLDDFAVLILFSVFESIVRARVLADVRDERSRLSHALVTQIVDGAIQDIEQGSFSRVVGVYKGMDANLVEEVNQVRRYRNWVAHGRRDTPAQAVDPKAAYDRLSRFLDAIAGQPSQDGP